jgi:hypothetical protein
MKKCLHAEQSIMRQFDSRPTVANTQVDTVRTPKLMDRLREALRSWHYSRRTEQTYSLWVRRYIHFHNVRHPAKMAESEVNAFLTHLAVKEKVSKKRGQSVKKMEKTAIFHQSLFLFFLCLEIFASFHFSRNTKVGNVVILPGNIWKNG